jgi:hypothetical protein
MRRRSRSLLNFHILAACPLLLFSGRSALGPEATAGSPLLAPAAGLGGELSVCFGIGQANTGLTAGGDSNVRAEIQIRRTNLAVSAQIRNDLSNRLDVTARTLMRLPAGGGLSRVAPRLRESMKLGEVKIPCSDVPADGQ